MNDAIRVKEAKLGQLRLLLKDPMFKSCLQVDGKFAKFIEVQENGDVLLGKYSSRWMNYLFNSFEREKFFNLATSIAALITGTTTNINRCDDAMDGFLKEIVNKVLASSKREAIIDMLWQYIILYCENSIYRSEYMNFGNAQPNNKECKTSRRYYGRGDAFLNFGNGDGIPVTLEFEDFTKRE